MKRGHSPGLRLMEMIQSPGRILGEYIKEVAACCVAQKVELILPQWKLVRYVLAYSPCGAIIFAQGANG
jgi:hypothetical protein